MNNHNLIINELKFLKASKKLLTQLKPHSENFKLTQIQEMLAQSLGFRNVFELQKCFSEQPNLTIQKISNVTNNGKKHIFQNLNIEQAIQMFLNSLQGSYYGELSMWRSQCKSLLTVVFHVLLYLQEEKKLIINSDIIKEYLEFDQLISLKNREDIPDDIKYLVNNYLSSLTDYVEGSSKKNSKASEQHKYTKMQLLPALVILKKIETNDFIIADKQWFVLKEEERIFSTIAGRLTEKDMMKEQVLYYVPQLEKLDFLEDSWLSIEEYLEWIKGLYIKNKIEQIYLSDLLVYSTNIISPMKQDKILTILHSILDNYSIASEISEKISQEFN